MCLDIGGEFSGAIVGVMSTVSGCASFIGAPAFGYIVGFSGSYDLPMVPMAAFRLMGACLWLKIDPRKQILASHRMQSTVIAAA